MTCREVPQNSMRSYDTLQGAYIGLGIRRGSDGTHVNVEGNLPTEGLNLSPLTPEAVACFNNITSTNSNGALRGNLGEISSLVAYLKDRGNTGDTNVITGEEIDAYVTAFMATPAGQALHTTAQDYRDLTVRNLMAYVGLVQYIGDSSIAPQNVTATDIRSTAVATYGSVQQMFTGLVGSGDNGTHRSVDEDVPTQGISLGVLADSNWTRFREVVGWQGGDPSSPLSRNARDIYELISYFRDRGNLDNGDANVITSNEIDAYVRAFVANERSHGNTSLNFDDYKATTVGNIRALLAVVNHIANPPAPPTPPRAAVTLPVVQLTRGATDFAIAAPTGGWSANDRIFINGTAYSPATALPTSGSADIRIPVSALTQDNNSVEIRSTTTGVGTVTLPVNRLVATATPAPSASAPVVTTPVRPEATPGESGWLGISRNGWIAVGGTAILAGVVGLFARSRVRSAEARETQATRLAAAKETEARTASEAATKAEQRVGELTRQVEGARAELEQAASPTTLSQAETRLGELNRARTEAQRDLDDARAGLTFTGKGAAAAEARFNSTINAMEAKANELRAAEAELDNVERFNPDDPRLPDLRTRYQQLEAELQGARNEVAEAAKNNVKNGAGESRAQAGNAIAEARIALSRIEAEITSVNASIVQLRSIGNAARLLGGTPSNPPPANP